MSSDFSEVKYIFSVILFVNLASTAVLRSRDLFRLDIVHYNDFHDRFEETSVSYPICTSNDSSCLGGFPRLYHEVTTLLKEKPGALLLNAGDTFQGTYWYTLLKWNVTQHFINMLPNDAHAIGNHEFDNSIEGLAPYLAALHAPVLAANLDTSAEPLLKGLYQPHIVIQRNGRQIGIIGVTTVDTKVTSKPRKVNFLDPVKTVRDEAKLLTDQGVDIIIVLSHCGLDIDKQIAREAGEHVDIIVGGHSHSLLWNGESPSKETVSGPYPVIVKSEVDPRHEVIIVTASAFTKYLGNMTVFFNDQGNLVSYSAEPVFLNRSIPEDESMKQLLQPYADKLHRMVNEVVGRADDDILEVACATGECALGSLMADTFLNATKDAKISNLPCVAFLLKNMIKGSISKGDITRGAIINAMPFSNKVVTFALPGKHLVEALEHCLSKPWTVMPFAGPWMPQVAGMQVTLNTTSRKVESIKIKNGEAFEPLQLGDIYQVTVPDFLAYGGNRFTMLSENARNLTMIGTDSKIFEDHIAKFQSVPAVLDHRITVVK